MSLSPYVLSGFCSLGVGLRIGLLGRPSYVGERPAKSGEIMLAVTAGKSPPISKGLHGDARKGGRFHNANCTTCDEVKGDGKVKRAYFINPKRRNFVDTGSLTILNRPVIYATTSMASSAPKYRYGARCSPTRNSPTLPNTVFTKFIRPYGKSAKKQDATVMETCCRWLFFWMSLFVVSLVPVADAQAQRHEEGRSLYNYRCYFCHGYSGNAHTLAATYLTPQPTDFTRADPLHLTPQYVVAVLEEGRSGTAMKSFHGILGKEDMTRVAEFVVTEFAKRKAINTRYHTPENGWDNHSRYQIAFPFAKGEIPLSRPWESLSPEQVAGKRLYLSACVSCHDRGARDDDAVVWDASLLSYPRNHYSPTDSSIDAMSSTSPYAKHDVPK